MRQEGGRQSITLNGADASDEARVPEFKSPGRVELVVPFAENILHGDFDLVCENGIPLALLRANLGSRVTYVDLSSRRFQCGG